MTPAFSATASAVFANAPASAARPRAMTAGWRARDEAIMGTAIRVELWSQSAAQGEAAIDAVMTEMHRIDGTMSPHKADSALSRINRDAFALPVALSEEMFALIEQAQQFAQASTGAFDITYAAIGALYDYRAGIAPTTEQRAQARLAVGWQHLLLDAQHRTVRFAKPGMRIDLGGFAKGHAVDRSVAILRNHGIAHALVSAGGDSRVLGDRRGRPWMIGVRDPRRAGELVAMLPLQDVAISTSGDYERYFERDGMRCHHLIDPRTGVSPDALRSVTVIGPDGLTTEALSKTVFVLGPQAGLQHIESFSDVDAVLVDAHGRLHHSSGLLGPVPRATTESEPLNSHARLARSS